MLLIKYCSRGVEKIDDIQYFKTLRSSMRITDSWPRGLYGSHMYRYYIFALKFVFLISGILYIRNHIGNLSYFEMGHSYITVCMNVVALVSTQYNVHLCKMFILSNCPATFLTTLLQYSTFRRESKWLDWLHTWPKVQIQVLIWLESTRVSVSFKKIFNIAYKVIKSINESKYYHNILFVAKIKVILTYLSVKSIANGDRKIQDIF